jgi:branched-chain amino acid transport system ATP-binding protein
LDNKVMLKLDKVNTFYGKLHALWDVSFEVTEGEIYALVGANGAGKTTLVKTISGVIHPSSGTIEFLGNRIDAIPSVSIVNMGISHIPESGRLFNEMSVHENLEMGAYTPRAWKIKAETFEHIYGMFPLLKERSRQLARTLSGGEKQMLAIGRGLMSRPKLLLFDEPSYGLSPLFVSEVFKIIKSLGNQGITVLLIEQNVKRSLEIADEACVIENGRVAMSGTCDNLLSSDYVKKAYLGL